MTAVDEGGWDPGEQPPPLTDDELAGIFDPDWDYQAGMIHKRSTSSATDPDPDAEPVESPFVDWLSFWARDRSEADFLLDDVIVRGRGHAVYAPHKAGKSLFTLWACVEIIRRNADVVVIYLDYEMTEDDLQERLEDMGVGADTDLDRLRYWLLPTLPPLNTHQGSSELLAIVKSVAVEFPDHHICVIIDTTSRAVSGEENDSGPYRDFYRLTGLRLKQMGVTWVRLDHEGKDPGQGQRGSSAKGDDIDVAWRVTPNEGGITLVRKLSRLSWVPEKVQYLMPQNPLRYVRTGDTYPAGTKDVVDLLDHHNISVSLTGNAAQAALKATGDGKNRQLVHAAQRFRKERDEQGRDR